MSTLNIGITCKILLLSHETWVVEYKMHIPTDFWLLYMMIEHCVLMNVYGFCLVINFWPLFVHVSMENKMLICVNICLCCSFNA